MTAASTSIRGGQALLTGLKGVAARRELILVAVIMMTVLMMILPVPTVMADGLIAVDIGMSLILVMLSLYVRAATELSTLPSLILVTTAFRLSISITTSRLVLVQGDAGAIIRTFGEFVIAGNVVVGLVVYLIITVVQFVVITKGSERVAEVAARFNLDALPGKQMSIDTDVRNGDLTQAEARRRRIMLERESHLYGAMDGAMKFVKGDAIASLIIIAVNLVGGIAIGCLQRGMPFSRAVQAYSLLAVGDGLIAQIPALMVSLTAGLVVTRAAGEQGGNLGENIVTQLTTHARPLQIAGVVLAGLGLIPGFPTVLFVALGAAMVTGGLIMSRIHRSAETKSFEAATRLAESVPEPARVVVQVGPGLGASKEALAASLKILHAAIEGELGIRLPKLRLEVDEALGEGGLKVVLDGAVKLSVDDTTAQAAPGHVRKAVIRAAWEFVGIQETQAIVSRFEGPYGDLVREAMKVAPLPRLAEILRHLLMEQVSVTNMRAVLEAIASTDPREAIATAVADRVRTALKRQLCLQWSNPAHTLSVILLGSPLEIVLREAVSASPGDLLAKLDRTAAKAFIESVRRCQAECSQAETGQPVMLASADIRRGLQATLAERGIEIPVLCHGELSAEFTTRILGTIGQPSAEASASVPQGAEGRRVATPTIAKAA